MTTQNLPPTLFLCCSLTAPSAFSAAAADGVDPAVAEAVALVDADRWSSDVEYLASLNRHRPQPDYVVARDWVADRMAGLGLTVSTFSLGNISGTLGSGDTWLMVAAHLDATSEIPEIAAPGAENNAGGCAAVLEAARILVPRFYQLRLQFLCFGANESDRAGSRDYLTALQESDALDRYQRMIFST